MPFRCAVLQKGIEVEDHNVHVVVPGNEVVVPQLAKKCSKHNAGANLVLIRGCEEIVYMANDQPPLIEESNPAKPAEVALQAPVIKDDCLCVLCLDERVDFLACAGEMGFIVDFAPDQIFNHRAEYAAATRHSVS